MKKTLLFKNFLIVLLIAGLSLAGWAQVTLPHLESFNYTVGQGLQTQAGWAAANSGDDILVTADNLSYTGLESSTGNKITFAGGGIDASKALTLQVTDTVVYYSFIMKVTSLGTLNATGGYFTGFGQNATTFGATIWTGLDGAGYKIGINPRTSTSVNMNWVAGTRALNDIVLVVVSYELKVGTGNDIVKIWINPGISSLGGITPPAADATVTNATGTDLTSIVQFFIRQDSDTETPFIEMDECRVGKTWADVTPANIADVTAPSFTSTPTHGDINVAINAPIILTFDEAIRNIDDSEITDANVASLLTLKETDASGAVVAFTATIDAAKKVITATPTTALANSKVYYAAINPVEDASNNATTLSSMTFTTVASTAPVLSDVTITEVSPYYAGDTITINWVSQNITDVLIEGWIPSENKWNVLLASTTSDGTEEFIIPKDAQYSSEYKIRISDIANPTLAAESAIFAVIAVVNNLASLRAQPTNAIVKYTGIATVTFAQTSRNQKYIQDATAAVLIDDPNPGFIGEYAIGEGITNVVGKILLYNALIEFTPIAATGEHATGSVIVPEVRTLESLTEADQSKLVTIENFAFANTIQYDPTGIFVKSKNYDITGYDNTKMVFRTAFSTADYIGGMVPVGTISSVCLVGQFNAQMQITARSWSDMIVPTIADFNGTPTAILENDTVQFMDMSTNNPVSWEWTFEGGHPATSTDQNPFISYAAKGNYAVTLKVTNASGGNNTITKTDYINVGVLGISTLKSDVKVYPNPTSDNLYISNSANDQLEITVLSSLGKYVKSLQANQGVTSVDLSDLPKGIYMVKMLNKTSRKTQMQKVVVR